MGHNYHYHDGTDEYVTEFLVRKADLEFDLQ